MVCKLQNECANRQMCDEIEDDIEGCEDFEQLTEEAQLFNTLFATITKLRQYSQENLIKEVADHEKHEKKLRIQIAELRQQILDKDQLRKECLQEVRKEVFGPFTIGQKVFVVKTKNSRTPCQECKGTRKITCTLSTKEEVTVECPKCRGRGELDNYTKHPEENIIKSISADTYRNNVGQRETITSIKYYMEWNDLKKNKGEIL